MGKCLKRCQYSFGDFIVSLVALWESLKGLSSPNNTSTNTKGNQVLESHNFVHFSKILVLNKEGAGGKLSEKGYVVLVSFVYLEGKSLNGFHKKS